MLAEARASLSSPFFPVPKFAKLEEISIFPLPFEIFFVTLARRRRRRRRQNSKRPVLLCRRPSSSLWRTLDLGLVLPKGLIGLVGVLDGRG